MKRIFLILNILIPLSCLAGTPPRTVSPTRVAAVVSSCRHYDGVEVIKLGRIGTAFLKEATRLAAIGEPEVREFVLFSPSDCMLMCVFGTISMDALAKLAFND